MFSILNIFKCRFLQLLKKWNASSVAFRFQKLQSLLPFLILHNFPVTTANLFDKSLSLDVALCTLKFFKF